MAEPQQPGANDATIVDESMAHAATVVAPAGGPPIDAAKAFLTKTLARTTVLPRVEADVAPPRLVFDEAPRYETLGALGEGGVGEVVKVRDNDIGRVVALKRLKQDMRSAGPLARFVEEIRTIGQLEHPNIVPIHDVGVDEQGQHFFVMKYVHGETLETIIDKLVGGDPEYHRRFTFEHRVQLFVGVLDAVAFAHDVGFIHRDIKPANVMVGHFGEVMLMDWGIAKRIRATPPEVGSASQLPPGSGPNAGKQATHAGALVGTPAYMSPEQARGEPLDERSDVYSLTLLFYELLTLRHPLAGKSTLAEVMLAVTQEAVPPAYGVKSPHQPMVPAELAWYLAAGLEKDKEKRYPSVRAMIDRLERRMEGDFPVQCHLTFIKRMTRIWLRGVDRYPMLMTIGVVLAVLAVPAAILLAIFR
jgi:serine/threonine-protein kinase